MSQQSAKAEGACQDPNPMGAIAQPVAAPLTRAAIFLVVTLNQGIDNRATVRSFCKTSPRWYGR
jgi:hypothetical protein